MVLEGAHPFEHSYLVHLGDRLHSAQLAAATAGVADYLCLNTAAPTAPFFDACRRAAPVPGAARPAALRSFGLALLEGGDAEPKAAIETAVPSLLAAGGGRRLLVVGPATAVGPVVRETQCFARGAVPTVVENDQLPPCVCWEAEQIPFIPAARLISSAHPSCASLASCLRSRIDVPWTPLPT